MTEPTALQKVQAALRDPEVQRLVREDPELAEYADRLPPAEESPGPDWKVSDEELGKMSPAAVLARQLMSTPEPETAIAKLFNSPPPGVEIQNEPPGDIMSPDPRFADRPDHEDFWALSTIVRGVDAVSDADNTGETTFLHTGTDPASIIYMAKQRALRGKEKLTDVGRVESAAILWVDGFTMGYLLAQGKAPTIQQLLDESIDGAHRPPRGDR